MILLLRDIQKSLQEPEFWAYSSWLDIVTKYRRSRLGLVWLLLPPLLYVGGVGGFYALLSKTDPLVYMPHLALGYLLFRLLSNVITESCSVLPQHASFILDGHLRLTDFVLRTLAKALFYLAAAAPLVIVVLILSPATQAIGWLTAPLAFIVVLLNLVWISVVVALLGARFPDVGEVTGSLFIFAFILTPILWRAEYAPYGTPHGTFMRMNPLFHMIEIIRAPLLGEPVERMSIIYMVVMTLLGWWVASYLYRRYSRFVPVWV